MPIVRSAARALRDFLGETEMICRKWPVARVGVFDHDGKYLENAQARLEDVSAGGNIHHLQWDRARGFHLAHAIRAGTYRLIAEAPGYESEARQVQVEAAGIRTVILLGTAGLSRGV